MASEIRVRFAPSPTGYLHVGGARTALFNYLFARHHKGTFILRIEDTDRSRFQQGALEEIYASLKWLGLDWDEGPEKGGLYGPYIQSERVVMYRKNVQSLLASGHAYRCFCSAQRLEEMRQKQQKEKLHEGYDRHCRELDKEEERRLMSEEQPFVVRFKIPLGKTVVFTDLIRGQIEYKSDILDDLVLLKSDGFPTYHLANVVDDHLMCISHVLRGDEWIASTPRHVLIYEAFGWTPPQFAHMPVILDSSGGKLSKRKGAASVMDYKKIGILPEALFNFLTLLGWAPGEDREKMSPEETIALFDLEKVSPKASVFDEKKLDWMNGRYLQERTVQSLSAEVLPYWQEMGFIGKDAAPDDPYLMQVITLLKDRSKRITEIAQNASYFFNDPAVYEEKAVKKHFTKETIPLLTNLAGMLELAPAFDRAALEKLFHDYAEKTGAQGGAFIHPTRLAVSGVSSGPGLFELLETLGKEKVIRRINAAIKFIEKM